MANQPRLTAMSLPVGYRFLPTDEELLKHYLIKKVFFRRIPANVIPDIHADELYSKSPKTLVENLDGKSEREWYFFIHQDDYFYGKIVKDRMVGINEIQRGFWRSIGEEETHWRMQEYRLPWEFIATDDQEREKWILGRITRGQGYNTSHV
nr:NAC domain-containing protein 101-like [Ipomoea batatas]GMD98137.1 NAC domain-containing protein 101-like [Ipomoea batatas]GMD99028.1 NAC domain-containing protein 101-like [Ipomoea batatas]